ncbi:hypothetical protein [Sulfuricurvum sp.]|uniref:hypothetical protein n=1 Tax=Sulfuricurvum sp. TaxID=2025608 RepID=UPI002632741D|nr:hypothetical protein [Sulfuricurvum sp.]MDD2781807.1 hypothetical protein [Sulfuricurvum sp.]
MQIIYNTSTIQLEDIPLDIGYASERVSISDGTEAKFSIGGQNGFTQLIITAPFIDEKLLNQLQEIDTLLSLNALGGITKALLVSTPKHVSPQMEGWLFGVDNDEEFGDYYGIRLVGDELNREFAKSLFIVSKDGAVFYNEIPKNLDDPFVLERVLPKIAAAQNCYTGKGCH